MSDYRQYCSIAGITNKMMVAELKKHFPKYGKPTQTMICDPAGYAVQLCPEAEAFLVAAFGRAPGLAHLNSGKEPASNASRNHGNKQKPNRLCVRLNDELFLRVKSAMERMSFATAQDFIEAALLQFVEKYGGAA